MIAAKGLPERIQLKEDTPLSVEYTLDQKFHTYENPGFFTYERTRIYYELEFKDSYIATEALFRINFREKSCSGDRNSYDAEFDYQVSKDTRQIDDVQYSHNDWPISNKHPSFYSGLNPEENEYFLVTEMMVLRYGEGLIERVYEYNSSSSIILEGNTYQTLKYTLNTSILSELTFSG